MKPTLSASSRASTKEAFGASAIRRRASAFTLIELLTVIAIIGILAAIIIPVTGKVRQTAKKANCGSNMRQIAQGVLLFAGENRGYFPNGIWDAKIAPYLNISAILAQPAASRASAAVLVCPSDENRAPTIRSPRSYSLSAIPGTTSTASQGKGVIGRNDNVPSRRVEQLPQPARTILVAERYTSGGYESNSQFNGAFVIVDGWLSTGPRLPDGSYYHGSTQNYAFCDGHVESLTDIQVQQNSGGFSSGGRWQALAP